MADILVFPTEGKQVVAKWWQGYGPDTTDTLSLHLFENNPDPFDNTLTETDFDECEFSGYSEFVCSYLDNGDPVTVGDEKQVQIGGEAIEFNCTGLGETVRGWYLLDETSGKVLYACKYETPVVMIAGAKHTVDIKVATGLCG